LSYLKLGLVLALPFALLSFALLFALVLYDFAHQILPTPLLAAFVVSAGFAGWLSAPFPDALYATALVAVVIGGSLALIHVFSRGRAMGLADAPLSFGLSLLTGTAAVPGFLFSFWIGALVGITILLKRAPGSRMGIEVPFAPYLAAGFILAYFTQWNPFPLL
jgi:prepilin signal peptidase PulO-like enzyme (type II secretory pathway)